MSHFVIPPVVYQWVLSVGGISGIFKIVTLSIHKIIERNEKIEAKRTENLQDLCQTIKYQSTENTKLQESLTVFIQEELKTCREHTKELNQKIEILQVEMKALQQSKGPRQ